MKQNSDEFVPETVDEEIERFLQLQDLCQEEHTPGLELTLELKAMYEEDSALLESVRERYIAQVRTMFASTGPAAPRPSMLSSSERTSVMQKQEGYLEEDSLTLSSRGDPRLKRPHTAIKRGLNLLAAAVLCLLLVGGAFTLLHQVHAPGACNTCASNLGGKQHPQNPAKSSQEFYTVTMINRGEHDQILSRFDALTGKTLWRFTIPQEITQNSFSSGSGESIISIQVQEAHGILYFQGTDHNGTYVYALHASDGSLVWKYPYDTNNYIPGSNVLLANGAVYLSEHDFKTGKALIVAVNATSGHVLWQKHYDGVLIGTSNVSRDLDLVAATGSTLYATRAQMINQQSTWTLYAINARTGAIIWQKQHPEGVDDADPNPFAWQLVDGVLYGVVNVSPSAKQQTGTVALSAYSAATGNQNWTVSLQGSTVSHLLVVRNAVYTVAQSKSGPSVFYALQASNGVHIWQRAIHDSIGDLAIVDGEVYAVVAAGVYPNLQHHLETLRASDGLPGWTYTSSTELSGVVVDRNNVYLGVSQPNEVRVFDRQSGKLVKTITIGSGQQTDRDITKVFSLPAD